VFEPPAAVGDPLEGAATHHLSTTSRNLGGMRARWPGVPGTDQPLERDSSGTRRARSTRGSGINVGELVIRPLATPGHTNGMLSFSRA